MRWSPKFNKDACNEWLLHIEGLKVIRMAARTVHLVPPFNIRISKVISHKIIRMYVPNEEKGGLMFAKVVIENNAVTLSVQSFHEVENRVEIEIPGQSKSGSYFPNREKYLEILQKNFSKKRPGNILFPIHFHTHPTRDKLEDLKLYKQIFDPLNLSPGDKVVSKKRHIQLDDLTLLYLNSIITGDDKEHRIIFYGNQVTPEDFTSEKFKQTFNTIEDLTEKIEDDGWKFFARIAFSGLTLFGTFKAPQVTMPLIEQFAYSFNRNEFWGKLNAEGDTVIKIPKREDE